MMVARGDLGVEMALETVPLHSEVHYSARPPPGQVRDHGHADARIDDRESHAPRAPRSATWPTPSTTAPTP